MEVLKEYLELNCQFLGQGNGILDSRQISYRRNFLPFTKTLRGIPVLPASLKIQDGETLTLVPNLPIEPNISRIQDAIDACQARFSPSKFWFC